MTGERSALVAMSGGVDSSAAAHLMLQAGFRCMGATMRLLPGAEQDAADARAAAAQLGLPFEVIDLTEEFEARVIQDFIRVYEAGGTPNPCVVCNRRLKFGRLLEIARDRGYECIATGHYARVERGADGRYLLKKALDLDKDQSYFLCGLTQEQLARVRLPLGGMDKGEVRALAGRLGLGCARRRDSQDICFVPDGDYAAFMERHTGKRYPEGDYLDLNGQVVGRHRGAVRYTLGQRRGLALPLGERVYVCGKDMARNTVTVGPESALYTSGLTAGGMNWIGIKGLDGAREVGARTRSRQREEKAVAWPLAGGRVRVEFERPQRAVTPGQALVLYDGDAVLGGGTILQTAPDF